MLTIERDLFEVAVAFPMLRDSARRSAMLTHPAPRPRFFCRSLPSLAIACRFFRVKVFPERLPTKHQQPPVFDRFSASTCP